MSDISCDCSVDVDNGPVVFHDEWRKARKVHRCCECGDLILPKQRHEYATGIWDGGWNSHRTCEVCVKIRDRYCPDGYIFGGLRGQIEDCLGFDYTKVPGRSDG